MNQLQRSIKGLVTCCHFFYIHFTLIEHTNNNYIYTTRAALVFPHSFRLVAGLLWGAEPRFELGPALQQAALSHAAPYHLYSLQPVYVA